MPKNGYKRIKNDAHTENASFLSVLYFQWMNIVLKTGNERVIDKSDFLPLAKENTTCSVIELLQTKWNEETTKCKRNAKKPKLWKCVLKILLVKDGMTLISSGILNTLCRILQPLLLGYLIVSLTTSERKDNYLLYGCALAMGINEFVGSLSMHQFSYRCEVLGIRISSALKGLVYLKTLLLSKDALLRFSTGHVIDLVSNDIQRLEGYTVKLFFCLAFSFLELLLASFSLVYFIGWQTLIGIFFLCLLLPLYIGLSSAGAALRLRIAAVSDRRISLMNQVVSGIRAVKTNAWEDEYREIIKNRRREEVNLIRKKSVVLSGIAALEYTSTPMVTLLTVITLVLTGQPLTPVYVFMLLSFINLLRTSFCVDVANGLLETYDAYVSLGRIEDFLLLENLPLNPRDKAADGESRNTKNHREDGTEDVFVSDKVKDLQQATTLRIKNFKKQKIIDQDDEFILQDIEFIAEKESLTVITGPVGSGKSILLSAIAGEVSDTSGTVSCKGTLVYVPQIAWIFSGTIRENILFGEPYDESRYTRIIGACALTEDIKKFPDFDQTVVGEHGTLLSGGQRARVSLARAVYADADIYLLDDPLSAVDFKVGHHIFQKCIKDLLAQKTLLIASHQEQLMKEADNVIVLHKGRVLDKGSFTELKEKGILNTTIDPLYKTVNDSDESFDPQNDEENYDIGDMCSRTETQTNDAEGLRISEEDRAIGVVSPKLYWNYFRSGVPVLIIIAGICLCLITQAMLVSPDVWLMFLTKKHPEDQQDKRNIIIFACLVGACFIFVLIRAFSFHLVSLRCSECLHDKMVVAVLQAPVLFFDSNPVGRIMNRFSKDVGCMDEVLPKTFLISVQVILLLFASVLVPAVTNPWLLFLVVPITVLAGLISRYYLRTSRELKRLESICRSPVFSHISETLDGLETIRTRRRQRDFMHRFYRCQDIHTQSCIMVLASGRWFGVRLDHLSALLTGAVALAAVLVSQDAAFAGLALVYVVQTVSLTQYAVRNSSEVENLMTSIERVVTYTKLDSEPGYKVKRLPPEQWPHKGNITFQDVSLTYYPGGPQVLKEINLNINGGAKIGVAGRTGAGKSSFVTALMRMPDGDGDILIDNVRINDINLQESRRALTVLGQSPVLFSGSVRKNLDFMEQFQDADLWRALEHVQLKHLVENLEGQLDHELLEHGANLSVGERQLICLARVLLQQKKIVILDEPTANVDPDTEQTIWNVVREKLRDSTVVTIAHRLNTIRDCDQIVVLKNGQIEECGKFDALVNRPGSTLSAMALASDI